METIDVTLTGTRPLLMHSDVYANPLDPRTIAHKEVTLKKKKTDDDHRFIMRSEWRGALYYDDTEGPYIPGINIESALVAGGKLLRLGAQLKRSIEVVHEIHPLRYSGPRSVEALWDAGYYDVRSVKVNTNRVQRCRPLFREWAVEVQIAYNPESIDAAEVLQCLVSAGEYCGIGDYRPKFGRFSAEVAA